MRSDNPELLASLEAPIERLYAVDRLAANTAQARNQRFGAPENTFSEVVKQAMPNVQAENPIVTPEAVYDPVAEAQRLTEQAFENQKELVND
ncbi:MAG TPA: hypothetical protein VLG25_01240 [Patescibacteria group bacterium]|nr:hypothetical protein [Patescibacteria group bacterium]